LEVGKIPRVVTRSSEILLKPSLNFFVEFFTARKVHEMLHHYTAVPVLRFLVAPVLGSVVVVDFRKLSKGGNVCKLNVK